MFCLVLLCIVKKNPVPTGSYGLPRALSPISGISSSVICSHSVLSPTTTTARSPHQFRERPQPRWNLGRRPGTIRPVPRQKRGEENETADTLRSQPHVITAGLPRTPIGGSQRAKASCGTFRPHSNKHIS